MMLRSLFSLDELHQIVERRDRKANSIEHHLSRGSCSENESLHVVFAQAIVRGCTYGMGDSRLLQDAPARSKQATIGLHPTQPLRHTVNVTTSTQRGEAGEERGRERRWVAVTEGLCGRGWTVNIDPAEEGKTVMLHQQGNDTPHSNKHTQWSLPSLSGSGKKLLILFRKHHRCYNKV